MHLRSSDHSNSRIAYMVKSQRLPLRTSSLSREKLQVPVTREHPSYNMIYLCRDQHLKKHSYRWVAGALDSAWRAVDQFLLINQLHHPGKREEMHKKWGPSEYWDKDQVENHIRLGMHHSMHHSIPPEKRHYVC